MLKELIVVRGGGDLATGTIHRLWSAGFSVVVLECDKPSAIRRQVSVCEAVYNDCVTIEGMTVFKADTVDEALKITEEGNVPVIIDPLCETVADLKPIVLIDAVIAKRNIGTNRSMAPVTIALGPGFEAGVDVDYVIETKRGHNLGRIIYKGFASPDTGIPGNIGGYSAERVIHSPSDGVLSVVKDIGAAVAKGEVIATIKYGDEFVNVTATIDGILRGMIRDGYNVTKGFKIADIDPRIEELKNCFTISDKARCIAGSVLELVCKALRR